MLRTFSRATYMRASFSCTNWYSAIFLPHVSRCFA